MGQGHTKDANGEQGASSEKSLRPSKSHSAESQVKPEVKEGDSSSRRKKDTKRLSPSLKKKQENVEIENGFDNEQIDVKLGASPPKPKRTFEADLTECGKENISHNLETLNFTEIHKADSSPITPCHVMNSVSHEPVTPIKGVDYNYVPQATSTPAPNGILSTGHQLGCRNYSDDEHTDVSDDEAYASEQQFRSSSLSASNVSLKSFPTITSPTLHTKVGKKADCSYEKRSEVNYGKFYNQSYLKNGSQTYRGRTLSEPRIKNNVNQFTRPENFSYSKEPPKFLKPKKGGMLSITSQSKMVTTRRSSSPVGTEVGVRKSSELVKLSKYPGGKPPGAKEIAKIDRDDWPAPPSPAAILPEILRRRRKSRGEKDEEEEAVFEDPKIKREIDELKKFKDSSGIGKVIYNELECAKLLPYKPLDPWKSSRVPNAAYEPKYQTRFQSPMFASPSRFIDRTRRSWDDSDIHRGYRTVSVHGNFPAPKPGYGLAPRAATLPVSGIYGGPLDLDYIVYNIELTKDVRVSTSSINTDTSKVTSTIFDHPGVSLMTFQKSSWHTEVTPTEYPYDRLKISNFDLPKDVDRNQLEIHLSKEDFENIFRMTKEEFKHLPEWKRNDMKRKRDLY